MMEIAKIEISPWTVGNLQLFYDIHMSSHSHQRAKDNEKYGTGLVEVSEIDSWELSEVIVLWQN